VPHTKKPMNKRKIIVLILGISLIISCKQKENSQISEIETWKLGWRMIENSMEDNYEIANLQFDSLRNITNKIDRKYLLTGLKSKNEIGKNEEIIQILSNQDENMLREICTSEFLSKFEICNVIPKEKVKNENLQNELIKMYVDDQAVRYNLMQNIIDKYNIDTTEITKDGGVEVDERNRNRLKEIIGEFGFPTKKLVGKDAIQGVFFIIQHSDGDKEWQKSQLPNIERAVENGDLEGQKYAYLYDRIKINSGEKQLYGTQFSNVDPINKTVELADTENVEDLDKRRMKIGMMPISMYKKYMLKNL
jgi:hypothetical protein